MGPSADEANTNTTCSPPTHRQHLEKSFLRPLLVQVQHRGTVNPVRQRNRPQLAPLAAGPRRRGRGGPRHDLVPSSVPHVVRRHLAPVPAVLDVADVAVRGEGVHLVVGVVALVIVEHRVRGERLTVEVGVVRRQGAVAAADGSQRGQTRRQLPVGNVVVEGALAAAGRSSGGRLYHPDVDGVVEVVLFWQGRRGAPTAAIFVRRNGRKAQYHRRLAPLQVGTSG